MPSPKNTGTANATPPVPGGAVYRRDQTELCEHLIVAVHGMGDQVRNDFAQNIAELFARHHVKRNPGAQQATRLPLGLWDSGGADPWDDHAIGFVARDPKSWLNKFAFGEIYWAQVTRSLDEEGHRLEESKNWAASVVQRLCQRHGVAQNYGNAGPQLAATVLEEIAETLRLLDRILWLAKKAGIVEINAAEVLNKYLGDVQQVADFRGQRTLIRRRFLLRMQKLAKNSGNADIHIVAHSEGTVVAFLGLLYALRHETRAEWVDDQKKLPGLPDLDLSWLGRVRSFSTLGSPIDKHLILWPEMWYKFSEATWTPLEEKIRWRNYYDFADPVGFELDTAWLQLGAWNCKAFDFDVKKHDHGFRRYPLPGKAHIDYFGDVDLFTHVIDEAIEPVATPLPPPTTWLGRLSVPTPFVIVAIIHAAAVFILHKALVGEHGDTACQGVDLPFLTGTWGVLGCTAILFGTTILSRVWRISRDAISRLKALLAYLAGVVCYWFAAGCYSTQVGSSLGSGSIARVFGHDDRDLAFARGMFILLSLAVVVISRLSDERSLRKHQPPVKGLRWMMTLIGLPLILVLLRPRLADASSYDSPMTLVFSAAAFFYLWWIGILLFDLSYVWKSYINTRKDSIMDKIRPKIQKPTGPVAGGPDGMVSSQTQ